ncbi:SAM-dependent methyltransferase [Oceanirhabdus sp. W0125-5]|uniref:SAM-dependent methyltransferase n=1 Tax=Oceanirhabdus sp. W0125-5 TaxID=2999116 RepID=UPI0022F2AF2F|nr:methyltransferase domain-containing protein [Oceanirhabdus sp. W0125-5]WBW98592.1 methyltransferase domain-containing protein [Oceanirhabdus sp. W0125-5]
MKNLNKGIINELEVMAHERFPLSSKYSTYWIIENSMAPNPLWFTEILANDLDLKPGMKVLDMGCGKGISSIFLAKEFGVKVWANDLWIDPTDNWKRVIEAGVEDLVYPIKAEAHTLPFPEEFFDVIICVSSYEYFGTDELYFPWYMSKLLKKNGQFAIVQPGLVDDFDIVPSKLEDLWCADMYTWHSSKWWYNHLNKTNLVDIIISEDVQGSWKLWLDWEEMQNPDDSDVKLLKRDNGEYLTWIKLIAIKKE